MKHLLLFAFIATFVQSTAFGQCTPDPQYANAGPGIYPDSATFITTMYAVAGTDYDEVLDVKTLADTAVTTVNPISGQPMTIQIWHNATRINSMDGLPAGFSYSIGGATVDNDSTWLNTGSGQNVAAVQGCLQITASASAVSAAAPVTGYTDYPLTALTDYRIEEADQLNSLLAGKWHSELTQFSVDATPITGFVLRVYAVDPNTTVAVADLISQTDGITVYPNPSAGEFNLTIKEMNGLVSYSVYDTKGSQVHYNSFVVQNGVQETLNLSELPAGLYTMVLNTPAGHFTQKLVKQ